MLRTQPNIIITGTPGTGKSSHCEELATKTGLHHLSINDVVKKHNIGEASDDPDDPNLQIVDEDRLLDCVENDLEEGGQIIDWHACDLFPPSMIDLVCVIRCDNQLLYDRLQARGYSGKKLEENMDCEIMEVLLNEAREAYDEEIVVARGFPGEHEPERRAIGGDWPLERELRAFVEHLAGGPPPRSSAADGLLIVRRLAELRELAGL